jgi:hypothetical protein
MRLVGIDNFCPYLKCLWESKRNIYKNHRTRGENPVTVTNYSLKPITITGVADWPSLPAEVGNQVGS